LHYLQHLNVRETYARQLLHDFDEATSVEKEDTVEIQELNKVINATLKMMPERCSTIFKMNRFEGKKYREIAEILSISVKTVEADMGKALQLFRKSLKEFT
jgi:RNA polymerase sigma-70 factor (ECF subfamily)